MSNGNEATVTLTIDELTRLIRDEMNHAIRDMVTSEQLGKIMANLVTNDQLQHELKTYMRDVNQVIDSKIDIAIDRTFTPYLEEIKRIPSELVSINKTLARVEEQTKHTSETVKDVKTEQQRQDKEQDEIKRELSAIQQTQLVLTNEQDIQKRAIFGDVTRPGIPSLVDLMSTMRDSLTGKLDEILTQNQMRHEQSHQEIAQLQTDVKTIQTEVETTRKFRERRQQIERAFIQLVPNAVKKTLGDVAWNWVKSKAIPATIGATLFSLLIQWLRATS